MHVKHLEAEVAALRDADDGSNRPGGSEDLQRELLNIHTELAQAIAEVGQAAKAPRISEFACMRRLQSMFLVRWP